MTTIASSTCASTAVRTGQTVAVLSLLVLTWSFAVLLGAPDPVQGVRMVIRLTARTSLVYFLVAFLGSALSRQWPSPQTRWLLLHRRAFGLAFAVSHAVHLAAIIAFARMDVAGFDQQTSIGNYVSGGLGYLFIALLAATSWDGAVQWLGARQWRLLHTVGIYYIWASFMVTFGKRIPVSPAYVLPVLVLVAALLLRLGVIRWTRRAAR